MNHQQRRTLQEFMTTLEPPVVLAAAKKFFMTRNGIYAAFLEKEGPTYVTLRGQGGEEVVIGVQPTDAGTRVSGSTYMFDQQIARFFATLTPVPNGPAVPEEVAGIEEPAAIAAPAPGGAA
jgi:hypothetical protein